MPYIDAFVAAVPTADKAAYQAHAARAAAVFKEFGAEQYVEGWGDDVPPGKLTSFPQAVQCREDETVVFGWVRWSSKVARDANLPKAMRDPRLNCKENPMPFDGKRMIFGGFDVL